jgi:hypothetical protein
MILSLHGRNSAGRSLLRDGCCMASEPHGEIRARRLRAVKLARKTILRADAEAGAASLPELRTVGREQASAVTTQ